MYTGQVIEGRHNGIKPLTDNEKELLVLIALGKEQKEMAKAMNYSASYIKLMIHRIRGKLPDVPAGANRSALASFACFGYMPTEEQLRRIWFNGS